MCRSMLSLSKTVHQIWCDHPFSLRNSTTGRTMAVGAGDDREVGGGSGQNLKKMEWVGNLVDVFI